MNSPYLKTAVVTGGGVGIGLEIARLFAIERYRIVITYRSHEPTPDVVAELTAPDGTPPLAIQVDLTDPDAVDRFATRVAAQYPAVDVLVHNAGGLIDRSSIARMPYELFRKVQSTNVDSVFLVTNRLLPLMGRGGRIVTIASLAGRTGGHAGATAYATAKAALFGFTRGLAKELASEGITVNAVAPGFIEATPFHDTFTTDASKQETISGIPLGRAGQPADVASAVSWLASAGAGFVTGSVIDVNGGQHFS